MRNDRSESLNRYLDELAYDAPASGQELEPELRATVHWFRDFCAEPTADPAFRARLEHDLMSHVFDAPLPAMTVPAGPVLIPLPGGKQPRTIPAALARETRPRRHFQVMSTAAGLLLMLGLAYVAFGQLRPESDRPRAIPAAFVPATPRVDQEHLLTVTLPVETIPPGQPVAIGWHQTFAPGAIAATPESPIERGVAVEMVLEGAYAVRVDAPIRVIRADGMVEEIAAGTETLLGPGDAVLYLDNTAAQARHNPGTTDTVVVGAAVLAALDYRRGHPLDGATGVILAPLGRIDAATWEQAGFVAGPLSIALQRVTVAPGGTLPPADTTVPTMRYVEYGSLTWVAAGSEATPASPAGTVVFASGQYLPWMPSAPDRTPVLRNDGAEPLVVLELTISPAERDAATPAP